MRYALGPVWNILCSLIYYIALPLPLLTAVYDCLRGRGSIAECARSEMGLWWMNYQDNLTS